MGRIKGRYEGRLVVSIDVPHDKYKDFPIAEIKEHFQKHCTEGLREELQIQLDAMGTVELEEQYLNIYEVTE